MLQQLDLFGDESVQQVPKSGEPKRKPYMIKPPVQVVEEKSEPVLQEISVEPTSVSEELTPIKSSEQLVTTIPEDQELNSKLYYPISEVAHMFNVNISLLRYWEKEFDIIKPRKNRKGDRLFRPEDIRNLKLIYFLLKEKRYTIEGAKGFLKKGNKVKEKFEAIESLKKIRSFLVEMKSGLS
jgi:DNA-binding transcriptional MerR regulator